MIITNNETSLLEKEETICEANFKWLNSSKKGSLRRNQPSQSFDSHFKEEEEEGGSFKDGSPFGARHTFKRPSSMAKRDSVKAPSLTEQSDGPSSELRKKLMKQKTLAEGSIGKKYILYRVFLFPPKSKCTAKPL